MVQRKQVVRWMQVVLFKGGGTADANHTAEAGRLTEASRAEEANYVDVRVHSLNINA